MRLQEFDILHELAEAAVLAVGHQVYAEVAALLHRMQILLVLVCPPACISMYTRYSFLDVSLLRKLVLN